MSAYRIAYDPKALRELRKLPNQVLPDVYSSIGRLALEPRPHGCKKLTGPGGFWRIRVGQYRVVYAIDDGVRIVTINRTAHRRDVYRA